MQEGVNCEIIIVDDGSTDGSVDWLLKKQVSTPELKIITQANKGVIAARNRAIKAANAPLIAFLDADDFWYKDKLQRQLQYFQQNPNCGLSFTNYDHLTMDYDYIIDCFGYWPEFTKHQSKSKGQYVNLEDPVNFLLTTNVIGTSCVVVRKSTIIKAGGFDPSLRSASDWDCWLRIALISEVAFTSENTMGYLMRPNSITSNRQKRLDAIEDIINRIGENEVVTNKSKVQANAWLLESYGEMYRENQKYVDSIKYSLKAWRLYPHMRHIKQCAHDLKALFKRSLSLSA
ncbi:hypothetical protein PPHE_a3366 [Pseudoalteromonas phenolica O-BC30]|nr:hypothetical protein [Pseudoalteromonas phenolica O-BC30]